MQSLKENTEVDKNVASGCCKSPLLSHHSNSTFIMYNFPNIIKGSLEFGACFKKNTWVQTPCKNLQAEWNSSVYLFILGPPPASSLLEWLTQTDAWNRSDFCSKISSHPTIRPVTQQHNQQSYHCAAVAEKSLSAAIWLHCTPGNHTHMAYGWLRTRAQK